MSSPDPTAVLLDEHRKILEVVSVLERALDSSGAERRDFALIGSCVRFLRLYADACHHGKEEDLLFPVLEEHGIPTDSGIIAVMMEEHREGRRLLSAMAMSLPGARAGDSGELECLAAAGWDYADLIRRHIGKEDGGLFEMAEQVISAPACARLCAAYERTCSSKFDGCTKAELEELAAEILAGGKGSAGASGDPATIR